MTDIGTDLFRRVLSYDCGDQERADLMRKVWSPTPWMVDSYMGAPDDRRYREILEWCTDHFGPQGWPIHDKPGRWYSGSGVDGWRWMGFADEASMNEFIAAWPAPTGVEMPG